MKRCTSLNICRSSIKGSGRIVSVECEELAERGCESDMLDRNREAEDGDLGPFFFLTCVVNRFLTIL